MPFFRWMLALFSAFFSSILVTQPLKVILFCFYTYVYFSCPDNQE